MCSFKSVNFLRFLCDSFRQTCILPDNRLKLKTLRVEILSSRYIDAKMLQIFTVKVISFGLAILGCKLFIREKFKVVS